MKVSVVIVTAERQEVLRKCVSALTRELIAGDEIMVVSATADMPELALQEEFPAVRVVPSERMNMPYQRNLGLTHSSGDIVAYIDDDAFVQEGWREAIANPYAESDVASVVGKVVHEIESETRSATPPGVHWSGTIRSLYHFDSTEACDVEVGQGGNMSFRREVLEGVGAFDADYLLRANCEETDLFVRLRRAGHRVVYNPNACVLHVPADPVGYTRSEFDLRSAFHLHRNRAYFFTKNYLGRVPFFMYLLRDSLFTGWICLKRILYVAVQTSAVFLLTLAGNAVGVWHGVKRRMGRKDDGGKLKDD